MLTQNGAENVSRTMILESDVIETLADDAETVSQFFTAYNGLFSIEYDPYRFYYGRPAWSFTTSNTIKFDWGDFIIRLSRKLPKCTFLAVVFESETWYAEQWRNGKFKFSPIEIKFSGEYIEAI